MLSIIIVSWNTQELLRRCLASIKEGAGSFTIEVIVVDNGSHDGTPEMIRAEFSEVILIEPGENVGFSAGNNIGLARAEGEWLMLLNPDTEIIGDALPQLVAFLQAHPTVGVVGAELLYADGSRQATRHRFPSAFSLFVASTPLHNLFKPLLRRYYMEDIPLRSLVEGATGGATAGATARVAPTSPHPVDWLSGAALLLRREVYDVVSGLDERFFMYFEETDWQRRIKAAGWSIYFVPHATIRHYEDASSGQVVAMRHIRFNRSKVRYAAKWHGRPLAALLRQWLLLLFAIEWLKEAAKWLLGHKRPLRAQRVREYRQVLQSRLM
jgi:GT2 family glycosyltransferase